jgi:hypothetical protein
MGSLLGIVWPDRIVTRDGGLWSWGSGDAGRLSHMDEANHQPLPKTVCSPPNKLICTVAAGGGGSGGIPGHSLVLVASDGRTYDHGGLGSATLGLGCALLD